MVNEAPGVVDADVAGKTYALEFGNITNAGTLEATDNATLLIRNSVVANSGIVGSDFSSPETGNGSEFPDLA